MARRHSSLVWEVWVPGCSRLGSEEGCRQLGQRTKSEPDSEARPRLGVQIKWGKLRSNWVSVCALVQSPLDFLRIKPLLRMVVKSIHFGVLKTCFFSLFLPTTAHSREVLVQMQQWMSPGDVWWTSTSQLSVASSPVLSGHCVVLLPFTSHWGHWG